MIAGRCAGLDAVEVLCGPLDGLGGDRRGSYDVALVVGVLEYAGTGQGGGWWPGGAAQWGRRHPGPRRGQWYWPSRTDLGLKYLLGFPEDHLGLPWVGWEGYRDGEPTTWSRRELAQMLSDAGLRAQRVALPLSPTTSSLRWC